MSMLKRRLKVYLRLLEINDGIVPCYVCGRHVEWEESTVEHKVPRSKGGSGRQNNLAISHSDCNNDRKDKFEDYLEELRRLNEWANRWKERPASPKLSR